MLWVTSRASHNSKDNFHNVGISLVWFFPESQSFNITKKTDQSVSQIGPGETSVMMFQEQHRTLPYIRSLTICSYLQTDINVALKQVTCPFCLHKSPAGKLRDVKQICLSLHPVFSSLLTSCCCCQEGIKFNINIPLLLPPVLPLPFLSLLPRLLTFPLGQQANKLTDSAPQTQMLDERKKASNSVTDSSALCSSGCPLRGRGATNRARMLSVH